MQRNILIGVAVVAVLLIGYGFFRSGGSGDNGATESEGRAAEAPVMEQGASGHGAGGGGSEVMAETERGGAVAGAQSYGVAVSDSVVQWSGRKRVGAAHEGTVALASGTIELDEGQLTGGTFTVDMTSLVNTDLEAGPMRDKLETHLKSDEFFGVTIYPTAQLVITEVAPGSAGEATVTGNLTIKEITQPMTFPVTVTVGDSAVTLAGTFTFDRSLFDVRFGSDAFFDNLGDGLVEDEVTVSVTVVGNLGQG